MKTKHVYELVFTTTNGKEHNLLFSSKRKANKDLQNDYYEGAQHPDGLIACSFIIQRILF